jgi:cyanoexosortase B-associated protein
MLTLPKSSERSRTVFKLLVVVFILAIAAANAMPGYFAEQWPWQKVSPVSNIQSLKDLQKNGLSLPGWHTLEQQVIDVGGHRWSIQGIMPEGAPDLAASQTPVLLMLRPQTRDRDTPQVDWMDINGSRHWTADSQTRLQFAVSLPHASGSQSYLVDARFLRGWSEARTYAVLQWYAWNNGGHPAPGRWFWMDQWSQWQHHHRLPWVAVSILIPIEPLGDIESVRPQAQALGQLVQSTLNTHVFQ